MIWEAMNRKWLWPIVGVAIAMAWVPHKMIESMHPREPINSYLLWATVLMMAIALVRIARPAVIYRDPPPVAE